MTVELAAIEGALRRRFPGRRDETYRTAALRVHANLEAEGPVCEVDRMFLGGPGADASDVDVLIERTLVGIRARNAAAVGLGPSRDELAAEVHRLHIALQDVLGCGSLEAARAVVGHALKDARKPCGVPWAAEHVRESEESRSPGGAG